MITESARDQSVADDTIDISLEPYHAQTMEVAEKMSRVQSGATQNASVCAEDPPTHLHIHVTVAWNLVKPPSHSTLRDETSSDRNSIQMRERIRCEKLSFRSCGPSDHTHTHTKKNNNN
ncbi:hypothetical protein CEXT_781171 [Caerostris extrusa]|uniref:Uncharacterized protein n=1 Tax=Caerostris extrusa TaxID=172846 RepID=A0AAV4NJU3_CAEEX|nr:hypothetical protein CEXT_781171 [Caerostris extrusa]